MNLEEKAVSDRLSANPWRAIKLFELLGCDIGQTSEFQSVKGVVGAVVSKRNNIIHYNDEANDISLTDVKNYIDFFKDYIKSVSKSSQSLIEL